MCDRLKESGYCHYEISNYAKEGKHSRHNQRYWLLSPYIGCGAAAHSFFGGIRYQNAPDISKYLSGFQNSRETEEIPTKSDLAYEYAILGLRTKEGILLSEYEKRNEQPLASQKIEYVKRLCEQGYATFDGDRFAFTDRGFYVSSHILTELF